MVSKWPTDAKVDDLKFFSNTKNDMSGPLFRLVTEEDLRKVEAGREYKSEKF